MQNFNSDDQTWTVRDLKGFLHRHRVSPEKLAEEAQLSHMTIRRWLKRRDDEVILEKYNSVLTPIFIRKVENPSPFPISFGVESLMTEIEKSGKEYESVEKLDNDVSEKLKTARVDKIFVEYCKKLLAAIKSPQTSLKSKALAIGALIYFISPIDLIPDHIPVIGYLDDLAVLSLVVNSLAAGKIQK